MERTEGADPAVPPDVGNEAREAITRYHLVAEQSRTVFWEVDTSGKYTYVSHVSEAVWGYRSEELVGKKHFYDIHPAEGREEFRQAAMEVFDRKEAFRDLKNAVERQDGSTIWVSTTGVPVIGPAGELAGYRGSDTDITERHQAEEELRAERQRLANVIEGTNAGIWDWHIVTGEVSMNERWAEIVGYRLEELAPTSIETWTNLVHPMDAQHSSYLLAEHFAGRLQYYDCECRMRHKDGSWVWVHDRGKVTEWDSAGAPVHMAGTHTDITKRKQAESELEESRERLRHEMEISELAQERLWLHMQGTPMAYLELDIIGQISYWNPAAEAMFGWTRDDVLAQPVHRILPVAGEGAQGTFLELVRRAPTARTTVEHVIGNGRRITCEWYSTRLVSSVGAEMGTACLGQDVTERNVLIEGLRRAKEKAEEAARAKSEFLSTISHELRTPMNGIIGMSSLLLESGLRLEQRNFAQAIRASADALLSLINEILDFSKVESGRLDMETVPFNLQTVIEDAMELMATRAQEKQLELVLWYPRETPRNFQGDVGRVRQILLGLLNNAVKFTERGHVLVEVSSQAMGEAEEVRISVQDTGVGIPSDKFDMLFAQFTQLDSSSKRRYGGVGLGLAISRRLAQLMNGDIHVVSAEGEGSTFTLRLPLPHVAGSEDAITEREELRGLRVLVVEDHQIARFVCMDWCTNWGMRAEEASCGKEALRLFREARNGGDPYGVVILDYLLPDMDGEILRRELHAEPGDQVPVVRFARDSSEAARADLGVAATVTKPVRAGQLLEALLRTLEGRHPPRAVQRSMGTRGDTFRGLRVLLVEDNAINQRVAAALLQKLGIAVVIAGNGREAVEMVSRLPFDLIFMDCQMPEMDGFEATEAIRRMAAPVGEVPIIALTAGAVAADREKCIAAGMDDYLSKPILPESLRGMVELWCVRKEQI